jgi:4-hydroxy-tetrahydrodipicolinate synthase
VCGLADDTVARLAELPQVVGLKDATGDMSRPMRLRSRLGPEFRLLSGDDATALAFLAQGGDGCISVASNVAPGLCRDMYLAVRLGQIGQAQQLASILLDLTLVLVLGGVTPLLVQPHAFPQPQLFCPRFVPFGDDRASFDVSQPGSAPASAARVG